MIHAEDANLGRRGRRRWSASEKLQIVQLTMEPGASIAEIARAHGVNANQVFTWRRLFDNSQLSDAGARSTALLPVADHPINRIGEFLPWNLAASLQSESAEAA